MALTIDEVRELSRPGVNIADVLSQFPGANSIENILVNEQDTPRLARGESTGTVVDTKNNNRRINVDVALSPFRWSQPLSPFNGTYPHNHVYQTTNGLLQEFDDTLGNERYHRYHPSGTFVEVDSEGNEVRKIIGDNYVIIEKNGKIFVGGSCDLTVQGKCNILVMNDCNLEINGSLNALVKNDISMVTNGCFNLNVKETFKIRADNYVIETSKYNHKNIGPYVTETNTREDLIKDNYVVSSKNYNLNTTSDINLQSAGPTQISALTYNMETSGEASIKSSKTSMSGDLHIKENVYVNGETHSPSFKGTVQVAQYALNANKANTSVTSGGSAPTITTASPTSPSITDPVISPPSTPSPVLTTGLDIPGERVITSMPNITSSFPNTRATRIAIENDGLSASSSELYPGYNRQVPYISNDLQNQSNILNTGRMVEPPQGSISRQPLIEPTIIIDSATSSQLFSKYFRVADLSSSAAFPHRIRSQFGLSELDIAKNLQYLSVNVLDKLVELYGRNSFTITSGFRPENQVSQHGKGEAVDIQFRNLSNEEYTNRANELVRSIPFDQLLLEFQSGGTGRPWFHISLSKDRQRYEFATFYNHRPVGGFTRV